MVLFMAMFSVVKNEKRAMSLRRKDLRSLRLEEEFMRSPGGTIVRRAATITQKSATAHPEVIKIWVKNSTDKAFQFRASSDRSEAYSSQDLSGFNRVGQGRTWAYTYVQVADADRSLIYVKVISEDGRYFWDVTTTPDQEHSFEIFWNEKKATYALRPMDGK